MGKKNFERQRSERKTFQAKKPHGQILTLNHSDSLTSMQGLFLE